MQLPSTVLAHDPSDVSSLQPTHEGQIVTADGLQPADGVGHAAALVGQSLVSGGAGGQTTFDGMTGQTRVPGHGFEGLHATNEAVRVITGVVVMVRVMIVVAICIGRASLPRLVASDLT